MTESVFQVFLLIFLTALAIFLPGVELEALKGLSPPPKEGVGAATPPNTNG